jgi:hypothetical protein
MENKQSDLEQFLKRLERCGDLALAAQRAGVSGATLEKWFNARPTNRRNPQAHYDPDILSKIALARVKANLRKNLRTPLMTPEDFVKVLRHYQLVETKTWKSDPRIIPLLIKNPQIKDQDGARKLKITIAAYKMRKKRLLTALFKHLTIPQKK